MVMVFDENGRQMPDYQGEYTEVKEKVLNDAPQDAEFQHIHHRGTDFDIVKREDW